mmetsp:Transcript_34808/g.81224  ORF Transcript_34808/g.81224 Transcript_34808/m.81224 type:complete len:116 (-) Transcript_34808:57-404(-)
MIAFFVSLTALSLSSVLPAPLLASIITFPCTTPIPPETGCSTAPTLPSECMAFSSCEGMKERARLWGRGDVEERQVISGKFRVYLPSLSPGYCNGCSGQGRQSAGTLGAGILPRM